MELGGHDLRTDEVRVEIKEVAGEFAGNKDVAGKLRQDVIKPALKEGKGVRIDFRGVDGATQSFMHALVSEVIRESPETVDRLVFSGCNEMVRSIVEIVVEYSQFQQVKANRPENVSVKGPKTLHSGPRESKTPVKS